MGNPPLPKDEPLVAELQVGSAAFWERCRADILGARRRVLIQAMTFEGDAAGLSVAEAIGHSHALDRRVLVDDYTRQVINDTFLALTRKPAIHAEARATAAMFGRLLRQGAGWVPGRRHRRACRPGRHQSLRSRRGRHESRGRASAKTGGPGGDARRAGRARGGGGGGADARRGGGARGGGS